MWIDSTWEDPLRRYLLTAAFIAAGLLLLWVRWSEEPAPEVRVERGAPERARSAPRVTRTGAPEEAAAEAAAEMTPEQAVEHTEAAVASLREAYRDAPDRPGFVRFVVETDEGDPVERWYLSSDCGVTWSSGLPDAELPVQPGDCAFQAWRFDGALKARSDEVVAEIVPGEITEVVLALPSERTGGLGVTIREHDLGIEILQVFPGTPAAALGLESGDLIVGVDGIDAVDLDLQSFIETMTGPEGTEVGFALAWEGDTGLVVEDLTLTRGFLESPGGPEPDLRGVHFAERAVQQMEEQKP